MTVLRFDSRPGSVALRLTALACLVVCAALPARAQISSPFVPTAVSQGKGLRPRNNSVQLFPLARFSGTDTDLHISGHVDGFIVAGEAGFLIPKSQQSFKVGGFAFLKDNNNLFEVHGKYYFNSSWGAQVGLLKQQHQDSLDVDAFALYNIAPAAIALRPWSVQLGAGVYKFNNVDDPQFTGFVQGGIEVVPHVTVDTSYWYIKTPSGHFDRVVLGAGYRF